MKRLPVHIVFALAAVLAAGAVGVQALRLQQLRQLNASLAAVDAALPAAPAPAPAPGPGDAASPPAAAGATALAPTDLPAAALVPRDAPRELRLAAATALARAGSFDAAFKAYSGLVEPGRVDAIGRQALYNLGNMVLRQGLGLAPSGARAGTALPPSESGPLLELAKQRYRDLLRLDPGDWDARYNLERALRAAPEEQEVVVEETATPVERRNVRMRGMNAGELP